MTDLEFINNYLNRYKKSLFEKPKRSFLWELLMWFNLQFLKIILLAIKKENGTIIRVRNGYEKP